MSPNAFPPRRRDCRQQGPNALSVPLVDHEAKVVAAVSVLGMGPQFDAKPASAAGRLLKQLGQELSSLLGQSDGLVG
jgi:DNA-binding IclR family transcriptional regulator